MLAQQRQQAIHEMVQRLGGVRVGDLVREFGGLRHDDPP